MQDVVVRYLQAHPELRDHSAIALVMDALIELFLAGGRARCSGTAVDCMSGVLYG